MPLVRGSEGEQAIDIGRLRSETGLITLDHGYMNTGSALSAITFLDGERGILRYRGYPIEQLAEQSSFLEVAYLLIYGELPTRAELDAWISNVTQVPAVFGMVAESFDRVYPTANPLDRQRYDHLHLARQIMERHRRVFGVGEEAGPVISIRVGWSWSRPKVGSLGPAGQKSPGS